MKSPMFSAEINHQRIRRCKSHSMGRFGMCFVFIFGLNSKVSNEDMEKDGSFIYFVI